MGLEQRIIEEIPAHNLQERAEILLHEAANRGFGPTRQPVLPLIPGGANRLNAQSASSWWKSAKIAVKAKGKIHLLNPARILAAEAHNNYVLLQQLEDSHMLREQISVLADKLLPFGFIRIHRSVLVNALHVEELEPLLTGAYLLRMKGGREYSVTRTYKRNLQLLARTWIGLDGLFAD